jgi:hypothetical protein
MPVTLATQEAEIRRIVVWNQPGQIACQTLFKKKKKKHHKKRTGGVAQGLGPEFKPQLKKKSQSQVEGLMGEEIFSFSAGIWTQGLTLARQVLHHLSHQPMGKGLLLSFILTYFSIWFSTCQYPYSECIGGIYIKQFLMLSFYVHKYITTLTVLSPSSSPTNAQVYPLLLSANVKPFLQFHLLVLLLEEECQNPLKFHSILYLHLDPTEKQTLLTLFYIWMHVCKIDWYAALLTLQIIKFEEQSKVFFFSLPSNNGITYFEKQAHLLSLMLH